jgi:hypothetical protein
MDRREPTQIPNMKIKYISAGVETTAIIDLKFLVVIYIYIYIVNYVLVTPKREMSRHKYRT